MKILYIIISLLLGLDNVFVKFKVGGISFDRLLEFVLFFVFFKAYLTELRDNPFFKKWNTFIVVFALIQLLANLKMAINGDIEFEVVYTALIKCFSFVVFSFLFLLIAKKDIKYINIVVFIHFIICMFAFLQHPFSPIAGQMLELKRLLFVTVENTNRVISTLDMEDSYISGGHADKFRLAGPFATTISFSYFAISSFIINFYLFLRYKKKYYLFLLITLFVAAILTQTRSLILAEICLVFGYLFFAPFKKHGLYKIGLITGALIAIFLVYSGKDFLIKNSGNSRIAEVSSSGGNDSRPLLWVTALYAVVSNPLGVTSSDYQEARAEMFRVFGNSDILHLWPHNGIINIGFHYTFFGYIVFFFLVSFLLRNINKLEKKSIVFFKLVLISYLIHTSFHNNFVLESDYTFLLVIMLISVDFHYNKKAVDRQFQIS